MPQPIPVSSIRYKDISLTFRANPVTGDIIKIFDDVSVEQSVKNLVLTMNYEIPFHPEQGCAVYHSLFENISPFTAIKIKTSILDVIQNFEKRVIVLEINVIAKPDENGYSAQIIYRIINRPEPITITVFLDKKR